MPGKISDLNGQTGAQIALTDLTEMLDVSDTSMAPTGTNKKVPQSEYIAFLNANGVGAIGAGTVTNTMLANMTGPTVKGLSGTGTAAPTDLSMGTLSIMLGLGTLATKSQVTNTELAYMPGTTFKANSTGSSGPPQDLSVAGVKTLLAYTAADVGALSTTAVATVAQGGTGRATATTAYGLIAAGTTATGIQQTVAPAASGFLKTTSTTALPAWAALTKTDVGLANVDNTADTAKPVSTATQTALDLKAPLASPTFTGNVIVPNGTLSTHAVNKGQLDLKVNKTGDQINGSLVLWNGNNISLVNETHPLTVGRTDTSNLALGSYDIQARDGFGGTGGLFINAAGGDITLGGYPTQWVSVGGVLHAYAGIDAHTTKILRVANGTVATDAVNKGQLDAAGVTDGDKGDITVSSSGANWQLNAGSAAPIRRIINAQTGTTYAPVIADENTMVTLSNAAAITVTLPSNATQAIPIGAEIDFVWLGVGQPSFALGSSATWAVTPTPGVKLRAAGSAATAKKMSTNGWMLIGDLSA